MSRTSPHVRDLAQRLIAHEANDNPTAPTAPLPFVVCEKLRPTLSTLMGSAGFRALLARALALAAADVPALRALTVKSDGSLDGLDQLAAQADSQLLAEAKLALVTQLLGLLIAFIGDTLTANLVHEVWPKLILPDPNPVNRGKI